MLADYMEYHLRQKLAPMLFAEDDPAGKQVQRKSVVDPAKPLEKPKKKARINRTSMGGKTLILKGLMYELCGLCRLVVVPKIATNKAPDVVMIVEISPTQKHAFKLVKIKPI